LLRDNDTKRGLEPDSPGGKQVPIDILHDQKKPADWAQSGEID